MAHPDNETLFNAKKELSSHEKICNDLKYTLLNEISKCKKATYSNHRTFLKRQSCRESKKDPWVPDGKMYRQSKEGF